MLIRAAVLTLGILALFVAPTAAVSGERKPVIEGEWSKPVADKRGYALRGRLCIEENKVSDARREFAVYIELQDASEFIGQPMRIFCDLSPSDFRPEYHGGLHCELLDANKKAIESRPPPFGGSVPRSQWVTLPTDGTIRVRTTPFGLYRPGAMVICPKLSDYWTIADDDATEYTLNGRFTVDPPADDGKLELQGEHVWRGTIEFPPLKIVRK